MHQERTSSIDLQQFNWTAKYTSEAGTFVCLLSKEEKGI
jgi:hypothetical protein